jgi:hypothetical protein
MGRIARSIACISMLAFLASMGWPLWKMVRRAPPSPPPKVLPFTPNFLLGGK